MSNAIFNIYDSDGRLILDLSQQLTRILGTKRITDRKGTIWVSKQPNERIFTFISVPTKNLMSMLLVQPITYNINGNSITYEVKDSDVDLWKENYTLTYGVY